MCFLFLLAPNQWFQLTFDRSMIWKICTHEWSQRTRNMKRFIVSCVGTFSGDLSQDTTVRMRERRLWMQYQAVPCTIFLTSFTWFEWNRAWTLHWTATGAWVGSHLYLQHLYRTMSQTHATGHDDRGTGPILCFPFNITIPETRNNMWFPLR